MSGILSLKLSLPAIILILVLSVFGMQLQSVYSQSNSTSNSTNSTASESPIGSKIVLLSQKLKKDSFGNRIVIGQVKNLGPERADYVSVKLTVYDKDGAPLATAMGYADPSELKPGQKSTFEVLANKDDFKGMGYYELALDWLNHRDSAQGHVEDAQIYDSTSK